MNIIDNMAIKNMGFTFQLEIPGCITYISGHNCSAGNGTNLHRKVCN